MPKTVDRATQTTATTTSDINKSLLWVRERKKEILLEIMRQNAKKRNWSAEELEWRKQKLIDTFKQKKD